MAEKTDNPKVDDKKADAYPHKEFFIYMITKDIALDACILDLVDNAIDGATRVLGQKWRNDGAYTGYEIKIVVAANKFTISDNCGGIEFAKARDYAFRFGRDLNAKPDTKHGIGLYGIGMKRALFKIGQSIEVASSTADESFEISIDVPKWAKSSEWKFDLEKGKPTGKIGTLIEVKNLNEGVGEEFKDAIFQNRLARLISRVYTRFIERGVAISVNGVPVKPQQFTLKTSKDIRPYHVTYDDANVKVAIVAGLAEAPPEDDSATADIPEIEYYGWYVVCNERIIISGNKDGRTVWGDEKFQSWHPQYSGFLGMVTFDANDPKVLPWNTTKADIDQANSVYRRAVVKMKEATKQFIEYTNKRKSSLPKAKSLEKAAQPMPALQAPKSTKMVLPQLKSDDDNVELVSIQYKKPREEIDRVAATLGNRRLSAGMVGSRTFDFYLKNEVG